MPRAGRRPRRWRCRCPRRAGGESLSCCVEVSRSQEGTRLRYGGVETGSGSGAAGRVECGLNIPRCRAGLRFGHSEQVVEPGRRSPAIPATLNQVGGGWPVGPGQGTARGHQAGDRADQPVRISSQGGVGLLRRLREASSSLRSRCTRARATAAEGAGRRSWGSAGGLTRPRPARRPGSGGRAMPRSGRGARHRPPAQSWFCGSGRRTGEGHGRWVQIARPELDGTTARHDVPFNLRMASAGRAEAARTGSPRGQQQSWPRQGPRTGVRRRDGALQRPAGEGIS